MATAIGSDENNAEESETPPIDVAGFIQAFVRDDSDTDSDLEDCMSMFCKACLHPYSGEEKSGTIVLRCKNCGQTDTILEEKVGNINPQQWIGDLMKNRFLQVIRQQENLKMNLVDPSFCDDDYQRVTLALQEYTSNIQAVAECMYDVVRQVNFPQLDDQLLVSVEKEAVEIEAMRATNRLIKIHKALLESSHGVGSESTNRAPLPPAQSVEEEKMQGKRSKGKRGSGKRNKVYKKPPVQSQKDDPDMESDMKEIAEMTRQHSQTLGNTVLTLINELIEKYELPDDLMERIEERIIRNCSEDIKEEQKKRMSKSSRKRAKAKNKAKGENGIKEVVEKGKSGESDSKTSDSVAESIKAKSSDRSSPIGGESFSTGGTQDNDEEEDIMTQARRLLGIEEDGSSNEGKRSSNGGKTSPVEDPKDEEEDIVAQARRILAEDKQEERDPFEEQFYAALEEKFSIRFNDKELIKWSEEDFENEPISSQDNSGKLKTEKVEEKIMPQGKSDNSTNHGMSGSKDGNKSEKPSQKKNLNMHFKKTNEGFMVNFYTLSAAFINELQAIKSQSLEKRKEKALAELHERTQMMKNEMEKIEDAVTAELAKAYEKKMRKSVKQREKLDEKQKQLREAEKLLCFYASTGQRDKIRAMNEELDKLCGSPN